jgi:hypothetical protein
MRQLGPVEPPSAVFATSDVTEIRLAEGIRVYLAIFGIVYCVIGGIMFVGLAIVAI